MVRVNELAAELEVPSSKVLEVIKALGIEAKDQASTISDVDAARVKQALKSLKTKKTGEASTAKKVYRVKELPTPKTTSVRPRPTLQAVEQTPQKQVVKKVVKRVVRVIKPDEKEVEATPPAEPVAPPPSVEIEQTVVAASKPQEVQTSAPQTVELEAPVSIAPVPSETKPVEIEERKRKKEAPEKVKDRDKGKPDKGEKPKKAPEPSKSIQRSEPKYAPVGKTVAEPTRKKPPKPKVPKIPSPDEYLRPQESHFIESIERLVAGGLRSTIDTELGRGRGTVLPVQEGKKRNRRRKIIAGEKGPKKQVSGGRGRIKEQQQLQMQLDQVGPVRAKSRYGQKYKKDKKETQPSKLAPRKIRIGENMSIRDLSAQTGLKSSEIIGFLMKDLEIIANINQVVDQEIAGLICDHFGFEYELKKVEQIEDLLKHDEEKPEDLVPRPPVITVLGHVDHGKTKLLDAIRGTDVVATEAGGITQKIGAFQVYHKFKDGTVRPITFIDTPGHAAFTAMRARGAQVTDIAVLVVAADDGVMPQTLEAIDHARSAGVEIVVAINKIDLPDANPEVVKQQLSQHGLVPEEWGGNTIMVPISAKKKLNIEELLEQLLTLADIMELKGNPKVSVEGSIIEARLDRGRGALATVLVQKGVLKVGDYVVAGRSWGKVRQMTDDDGHEIKEAPPSTPVLISGLNQVPEAGDKLYQVEDEKTAREIYEKREMEHRQGRLRMVNTITLEDFFEQMRKGETKELNIILKADMQGSIEAVRGQLEQLSTSEVAVKFIHTAVGNVTDSDIMLALASKAIIVGFNVVASPEIRKEAAMEGVEIRTYNIIYKLVDDIKAALEGMLEPVYEEHITGKAEVKVIFKRTGRLVVAGLMVNEGKLVRGGNIRIIREGQQIAQVTIDSLKRFKDDVNEVESGMECGLGLDGYNDLKEGDELIAFETVKILRTLDSVAHK